MIKIQIESNHKPFTYQLIKENSIKQDQFCQAIAVNKDCSILVAGCDKQIKVFDFKQSILKELQILDEHSKSVSTLNFMKNFDQFISGSYDGLIIIWAINQSNQWICEQKLNGHTSEIECLALNNNEDLIASGGDDNIIKLWQKKNEWLCSQTITDHTGRVLGLSFNEQQNRLISCGQDQQILVIEQSEQSKQWNVVQKIKVKDFGLRLCFIDNNAFTLYPWGEDYMDVFELDISNQQYSNTKSIPLKVKSDCDWAQFPQQYIKSKCIIVNKNASNVNLIRKQQNGEFTIEQSIQFGTYKIFGCMTDDGKYLITWDSGSKEYQIRKYQKQ